MTLAHIGRYTYSIGTARAVWFASRRVSSNRHVSSVAGTHISSDTGSINTWHGTQELHGGHLVLLVDVLLVHRLLVVGVLVVVRVILTVRVVRLSIIWPLIRLQTRIGSLIWVVLIYRDVLIGVAWPNRTSLSRIGRRVSGIRAVVWT